VTFCNLLKEEKEGAKDAKVFLLAIDCFHLLQKYILKKIAMVFFIKKIGLKSSKKKV
jgi:hypothetical protein